MMGRLLSVGVIVCLLFSFSVHSNSGSEALDEYYSSLEDVLTSYGADESPFTKKKSIVVKDGDTLMTLARDMKLDEIDTLHMAVAIFENNGGAFKDGDPARLLVGKSIKLPTVEELFESRYGFEHVYIDGRNIGFGGDTNVMRDGRRRPFHILNRSLSRADGDGLADLTVLLRDDVSEKIQSEVSVYVDETMLAKKRMFAAEKELQYEENRLERERIAKEKEEAARLAKIEAEEEAARLAKIEAEEEAARVAKMEAEEEAALVAKMEAEEEVARLAIQEAEEEAARLAKLEEEAESARVAKLEAESEADAAAARVEQLKSDAEAARVVKPEKLAAAVRVEELRVETESAAKAREDAETLKLAESLSVGSAVDAGENSSFTVYGQSAGEVGDDGYIGIPRGNKERIELQNDPLSYPVEWSVGKTVLISTVMGELAEYIGYSLEVDYPKVEASYARVLPGIKRSVSGVTVGEAFELLAGQGFMTTVNHSKMTVRHIPREQTVALISDEIEKCPGDIKSAEEIAEGVFQLENGSQCVL